jgi:hypothetical protein
MWMLDTVDVEQFKVLITIWCAFYLFINVFGFEKGSIFTTGIAITKILFNKDLTSDQKLGLIMSTVQSWLNIAADLSIASHLEEKKEEKIDTSELEKI